MNQTVCNNFTKPANEWRHGVIFFGKHSLIPRGILPYMSYTAINLSWCTTGKGFQSPSGTPPLISLQSTLPRVWDERKMLLSEVKERSLRAGANLQWSCLHSMIKFFPMHIPKWLKTIVAKQPWPIFEWTLFYNRRLLEINLRSNGLILHCRHWSLISPKLLFSGAVILDFSNC